MKSFRQYLEESEYSALNPVAGDQFAINIREEYLLETYVVESEPGSVTIYGDDQLISILESYGCIDEKIIDVDGTAMNQYDFDTEEEVAESDYPGSQGTWVHGGHKVNYDPASFTLTVSGAGGTETYQWRSQPSAAAYRLAVQKLIDRLEDSIDEAKYQGREVPLGKPMAGDVKKSKVYVKNPQGNVVKVNFGDPDMKIKKSNPARRKSFRARHNCDNPGPRHKARYWSCRAW